jgi:hypothetical protein
MAIKINLKDIPQITSAEGTDLVLVAQGASGTSKLCPASELGGASGATGIRLTCEDNGFTYQISSVIVDGEPTLEATKVTGAGQFTSVLNEDDGIVYAIKVRIVEGQPTIVQEPLS